LCRHFYI
jgi:hypothetical protein